MKVILAVKSEKILRLRTHDLRDTGVMLVGSRSSASSIYGPLYEEREIIVYDIGHIDHIVHTFSRFIIN